MKRKSIRKPRARKKWPVLLCVLLMIITCVVSVLITLAVTAKGQSTSAGTDAVTPDDAAALEDTTSPDGSTWADVPSASCTILSVRAICQYPELPTGCEATSAVMAMNYLGAGVYLESFADLLPCAPVTDNGICLCGPDPASSFAGDPHKETASFGCFEDVIIHTVNENYPALLAQKAEGTIDDLCSFINLGYPVLIWTTMELQEIRYVTTWMLPDGSTFTWPGREHCMLLVGYDDSSYYFNDPRNGECIAYDKDLSEQRYEEMGRRAVVITPA